MALFGKKKRVTKITWKKGQQFGPLQMAREEYLHHYIEGKLYGINGGERESWSDGRVWPQAGGCYLDK